MRQSDSRPLTIVASIHRHILLFKETVLPWQTISGLAWLLTGIFCSAGPIRLFSDWSILVVVAAMTTARFSGMCWNRLIDWQIDARNPRTARRALPSGRLSQKELAAYALLTLALFLSTCFFFPPVGRWIGIAVAITVLFYSFTKRFTVGCHGILGLLHACLPIVGAIWQSGHVSLSSALFGCAAFASVTGTDILYSLQDEVFDRRFGLFSIPSRYGTGMAMQVSSILHALAFVAITLALMNANISFFGYIPWGICMALLLSAWHSVWERPSAALPKAFPLLLVGFSVSSLIILAVDKAWKALS